MSVFEKFFKLSNTRIEDEHQKKMNLLMQVTNSKMTEKEVERVYKTLDEEIIKKMPRNVQIIEAMEMIQKMKGDWLTEEEKENFVAGVWMFDTLKSEEKNKNYIYITFATLVDMKISIWYSYYSKNKKKI